MSSSNASTEGFYVYWCTSTNYLRCESYSRCETFMLTETLHNGRRVMRTQDGKLAIIVANRIPISDSMHGECWSDQSWSTSGDTIEQQRFLSTNPDLIRIVSDIYKTRKFDDTGKKFSGPGGKLDYDKMQKTFEQKFPGCRIPRVENGLRLEFIPAGLQYKIRPSEYVEIYKQEEFEMS